MFEIEANTHNLNYLNAISCLKPDETGFMCSIVAVFDFQMFDYVRLSKFWVSLIKFDYRSQRSGDKMDAKF